MTTTPKPTSRCACGKEHRSWATWDRCPSNAPTPPPPPVEVSAADVLEVLSGKLAAFVACPWGGVMPVALPYRGQKVVADSAFVRDQWLRLGRSVSRTAEFLAADLAWVNVPDVLAAVAA